MKYLNAWLVVGFCIGCLVTTAQIDSKTQWVYDLKKEQPWIPGNYWHVPVDIEVDEMVVFKNQECWSVTIEGEVPLWYSMYMGSEAYIYEEAGIVFYFNPIIGDFTELFNRNIQLGDTILFKSLPLGNEIKDIGFVAADTVKFHDCSEGYSAFRLNSILEDTYWDIVFHPEYGYGEFFIPPDFGFGHYGLYQSLRCFNSLTSSKGIVSYDCYQSWTETFGFQSTSWSLCEKSDLGRIDFSIVAVGSELYDTAGMTCTEYVIESMGHVQFPDSFKLCAIYDEYFLLQDDELYPVWNSDVSTGDKLNLFAIKGFERNRFILDQVSVEITEAGSQVIDGISFQSYKIAVNDEPYQYRLIEHLGYEDGLFINLSSNITYRMLGYSDPYNCFNLTLGDCVESSVPHIWDEQLQVIPNPNSGVFNIPFSEGIVPDEISVMDSNGNRINAIATFNSTYIEIRMPGSCQGHYYLSVILPSRVHTISFICI